MLLNFNALTLNYCFFNCYICTLEKNTYKHKFSKENDESRHRSKNL